MILKCLLLGHFVEANLGFGRIICWANILYMKSFVMEMVVSELSMIDFTCIGYIGLGVWCSNPTIKWFERNPQHNDQFPKTSFGCIESLGGFLKRLLLSVSGCLKYPKIFMRTFTGKNGIFLRISWFPSFKWTNYSPKSRGNYIFHGKTKYVNYFSESFLT